MLGKRRFFKVPKHQQFDYKPMYYDPRKEELEDRLAKLRDLQKEDVDGVKARISSGIRGGYGTDEGYRRQQVRSSNLRILVLIVALLGLGYLLFALYLPELQMFLQ